VSYADHPRHITESGYVNTATVECDLAALCLQYLTFECFDDEVGHEAQQHFALTGILSFQDYAVAKWLDHVRKVIETIPEHFSWEKDFQDTLGEVQVALDDFASRYENDILHSELIDEAVKACDLFRNYPFHSNLVYVCNHIYRHQRVSEAKNDVSITSLGSVLLRNRIVVEELYSKSAPNSGVKDKLMDFYGERLYKCPKTTCFYFHEGYKDLKTRNQHINRHDRPFHCTFPDCSIVEFGFSSNKDMEKHMRFFHPELTDQADSFTVEKKPMGSTPWECTTCGKKFTRGFHQRNHMRSHAGDRPYKCSECGKAFTRANDCKRHEKIHSRR
jgi:DNA-directed RNA polymerase subunit RPC12/RpoP